MKGQEGQSSDNLQCSCPLSFISEEGAVGLELQSLHRLDFPHSDTPFPPKSVDQRDLQNVTFSWRVVDKFRSKHRRRKTNGPRELWPVSIVCYSMNKH